MSDNSKIISRYLPIAIIVVSVICIALLILSNLRPNGDQQVTDAAATASSPSLALSPDSTTNVTTQPLYKAEPDLSPKDVPTLSLGNGKKLFFVILDPGADCGSGGCTYSAFVGTNLNTLNLKNPIGGFDSYSLDCSTDKVTMSKNTDGTVFGFLKTDSAHSIVRIYYHLDATQGTEDIYHIAQDGSPTLIASYDNTCGITVRTLFRSSTYPPNLTTY